MKVAHLALSLGALAAPSLAQAQQLGGGETFEVPLLRLTLGLLLCSILAVIAALTLKRFMRAGASLNGLGGLMRAAPATLRVLETRRLSPHADVCVFTYSNREYVVVVSVAGATLIHQQEAPSDAQPSP